MNTTATIFFLLVAFQVKHLFADFVCQTDYMAGKFRPGWNFVWPLVAHAGHHAAATLAIGTYVLAYSERGIVLCCAAAAFDFLSHFVIDRVKASPSLLGRWQPLSKDEYGFYRNIAANRHGSWAAEAVTSASKALRNNRIYHLVLGTDQCLHHLTHYCIILFLLAVR